MKYPIGIQDFESLRVNDYTYVDKTEMIYWLANEGKYYFLSRPRRFGKSLLMSTMAAYFSGQRDLFKGLAMEKLEKEWKKYPVFHLDLNTDKYDNKDVLEQRLKFAIKWQTNQHKTTHTDEGKQNSDRTGAYGISALTRHGAAPPQRQHAPRLPYSVNNVWHLLRGYQLRRRRRPLRRDGGKPLV